MQVVSRTLTVTGLSPVYGHGKWKTAEGRVDYTAIQESMQEFTRNGAKARQRASERRDGQEWQK